MNHPTPSNAPSAPLSTTAITAIATGIGISLICIIALIFLLVRAVRNHKQLLADLEERGVSIAQARGEARNSLTRPRTVLRRNTVLPFNRNSGWGTLTSVETIKSAESSGMVAHYVPPKPSDAAKKASRLSWPFHTRRVSGHSIHLKRMKGPRLSTVLEDPKPSALVPVLNKSHLNVSRPSLTVSYHESRRSSSQSLLQYHPAFRNPMPDRPPVPQDRPSSGNPFFRSGANDRLQRAKSFADVPTEPLSRPPLRARSASLSDRVSGQAPDIILPPLPLDIARIKSEAKRRSQLKRIPSKQSECSVESANTSILASGASPVVPPVAKRRAQKITKPRTRGSNSVGSRPFRDSFDLRAKVLGLRPTPSNSSLRTDLPSPEVKDPFVETRSILSEEFGSKTRKDARPSRPTTMYNIPSSNASPNNVACPTTPKRKLTSQTYCEGSPERQKRSTTAPRTFNGVAVRSPKRQHSQTSSRSSGGNPFQWDPSPLASAIKPSALKGSPSARQGHRRKNSVRISLVPTFHGPPTRSPSPSFLVGDVEEATEGAVVEKPTAGLGLAVPASPRALPTPPSSSTFAPELKFPTTSLRASLTSTSPTLPLVGYDQSFVVFPTDQVLNELSQLERDQTSRGSVISLPPNSEWPSPMNSVTTKDSSEKASAAANCYGSRRDPQIPETPYLAQIPFRPETPEDEQAQCYSSFIDLDIYDSERSNPAYQTPIIPSARAWQSAFAAIPEESSVSSQRTIDVDLERHEDSPPISPKSASPPKFNLFDRAAYNLPVYATTIPEETPDTIDPFLLSKDTFALLNNTIKGTENGLISLPNSSRSSLALAIPRTQKLADLAFEPLLQAAFPFGSPTRHDHESPVLGHVRSEVSSVYSLPSPLPSLSPTSSPIELPSPVMPCSPRPSHARLPMSAPSVAIDFSDMPRLAPSPQEPRRSAPRPLRTSIAALRRMNSDVANTRKEKAGHGERRYLRLGWEDSTPSQRDESWLDDMEDDQSTQMSDLEGISLAADALDEWDEGQTILDLNEGSTLDSISTITPDTESYAPLSGAEEQEDTMAGAEEPESSIWDDGERFWNSQIPPRPSSPTKPKDDFQYRVSSPLASQAPSISTTDTVKLSKKRDFEVAKDTFPLPPSPTANREKGRGRKKRRESADEDAIAGASSSRYRKRSVLGVGTPNVRIQVTSPSGRIVTGTPGSLYDSQGFLRH